MSNGAYTQLTLTLDLFIGGHRNFDEVAKSANVKEPFKGCVQKVSFRFLFLQTAVLCLTLTLPARCQLTKCADWLCAWSGDHQRATAAAALERVADRHAATAVEARLVDARVLAVLHVRAVQVLLQQLQRPLVDDHLTTAHSQSARLVN